MSPLMWCIEKSKWVCLGVSPPPVCIDHQIFPQCHTVNNNLAFDCSSPSSTTATTILGALLGLLMLMLVVLSLVIISVSVRITVCADTGRKITLILCDKLPINSSIISTTY